MTVIAKFLLRSGHALGRALLGSWDLRLCLFPLPAVLPYVLDAGVDPRPGASANSLGIQGRTRCGK